MSRNPAPALYRSLVVAQIHMGEGGYDDAAAATAAGLAKFPSEVSLLGLGVDLALAGSRPEQAKDYMTRLPAATVDLPQWMFRRALLSCLEGQTEQAVSLLETLLASDGASVSHRSGTWSAPIQLISELTANPTEVTCRSAAIGALGALQP